MLEIACVVLGAVLAIITTMCADIRHQREEEGRYSKLLYLDLLSILKYFNTNSSSKNLDWPDIRYNNEWQTMLMNISKLTTEEIVLVHNLYDLVYDYNWAHQHEQWTTIEKYYRRVERNLQKESFSNLMKKLEKRAKIK